MNSPLRRLKLAAVLGTAAALVLTACSTGATTAAPETTAPSASSAAFPVTIDSALGAVTIDEKPERVVTIGWGSQDVALALGVVPVGMQDMTGDTGDDTGILPWDRDAVGEEEPELIKYTSDDVPYEKILALKPDVILATNSGVTEEQYAKLSDIAPTVAYPGKPWLTSWQDQTTLVGKALGQSAEAEKLIEDTNTLIETVKSENPEFEGKTIAFTSGTATDSVNAYLATDSRVTLLAQLGFTIAPSVPETAPTFAAKISLENVATIDSDVLVSWYLTDEVKTALESNPLFAEIPAVKNGGYVPLTDPAMVYATSAVSVLSLPWMLDQYVPLLKSAAEGKSPLE